MVTCLVDLLRPAVGFAAVRLLEAAGCRVEVPPVQTCCGQPAYNGGDAGNASALARRTIAAFEPFDYLVAPSGSCAAMVRVHYPKLLADDPAWEPRARALAARSSELLSFLQDQLGIPLPEVHCPEVATYHDSCTGLRELGIRDQPRALLAQVRGLELRELEETESCCGFGGTFCVKYPEVSQRLVDDKCRAVEASDAALVLGGDLGCLLNIAGRLHRRGSRLRCRHAAEVLAGLLEAPAIGEPERRR